MAVSDAASEVMRGGPTRKDVVCGGPAGCTAADRVAVGGGGEREFEPTADGGASRTAAGPGDSDDGAPRVSDTDDVGDGDSNGGETRSFDTGGIVGDATDGGGSCGSTLVDAAGSDDGSAAGAATDASMVEQTVAGGAVAGGGPFGGDFDGDEPVGGCRDGATDEEIVGDWAQASAVIAPPCSLVVLGALVAASSA